jgi:hypothetical protein
MQESTVVLGLGNYENQALPDFSLGSRFKDGAFLRLKCVRWERPYFLIYHSMEGTDES